MEFTPLVNDAIQIEGERYQFAEHPAAPGSPFGAEGRAAYIYKLNGAIKNSALKVFKERYRLPSLVTTTKNLGDFSSIPGLSVCQRKVLRPDTMDPHLRLYPDLHFAVLMPWIEGPTWFDVLVERRTLISEQCLTLARSLCTTLMSMEQQGLAHCDLSGGNIILPVLHQGGTNRNAPVELVDVEGLFGPNLKRPEVLTTGTYPHPASDPKGEWNAKADRFAGAALLAEFLSWLDPEVQSYVKRTKRDTYFNLDELQRDGEGSRLIQSALRKHWGQRVENLFVRAWNSPTLSECPTFAEWWIALEQIKIPVAESASNGLPVESGGMQQTVTVLLDLGAQLNNQGNHVGALAAYRQALSLVSPNTPLYSALTILITSIETPPRAVIPPSLPIEPVDIPTDEWRPDLPGAKSRASELQKLAGIFLLVAVVTSIGAVFFTNPTLNRFDSQLVGSMITATCIGALQTWLFRLRLRAERRLWFFLAAVVGGSVGGSIGGYLLTANILNSSTIGGVIGLIAGAVTALGQNTMMRGGSRPARLWIFWNSLSWGFIWLIGWSISWNFSSRVLSASLATAIGVAAILLLTGISLSIFLHYRTEIEF